MLFLLLAISMYNSLTTKRNTNRSLKVCLFYLLAVWFNVLFHFLLKLLFCFDCCVIPFSLLHLCMPHLNLLFKLPPPIDPSAGRQIQFLKKRWLKWESFSYEAESTMPACAKYFSSHLGKISHSSQLRNSCQLFIFWTRQADIHIHHLLHSY